jgi:hypothetical protein
MVQQEVVQQQDYGTSRILLYGPYQKYAFLTIEGGLWVKTAAIMYCTVCTLSQDNCTACCPPTRRLHNPLRALLMLGMRAVSQASKNNSLALEWQEAIKLLVGHIHQIYIDELIDIDHC